MRWLVLAGVTLALGLVVAWMLPAAIGPLSIECGNLEPVTCERVWRKAAAEHADGIEPFLPVTKVQVLEMTEGDQCGGVIIERWIFSRALNDYCH
jgi:hypothetical protein